MPAIKIFWDPQGISLDSLGSKDYLLTGYEFRMCVRLYNQLFIEPADVAEAVGRLNLAAPAM